MVAFPLFKAVFWVGILISMYTLYRSPFQIFCVGLMVLSCTNSNRDKMYLETVSLYANALGFGCPATLSNDFKTPLSERKPMVALILFTSLIGYVIFPWYKLVYNILLNCVL